MQRTNSSAPRRGGPGAALAVALPLGLFFALQGRALGLSQTPPSPSASATPQSAGPSERGAKPKEASGAVVARGAGRAVTRAEMLPTLLDRFALASVGRDLLKLLISSKVLDQIAREEGLIIDAETITRRWRELDQDVRAAGGEGGIEVEIANNGISPEEFREYLRLQLVQEELTRRALGLDAGAIVTPDSQEVWLAETLVKRGHKNLPPPWHDGVVARCGEITVTTRELGSELLSKLGGSDVLETAWHLLLLQGLEARLPDLSAEARIEAVEKEMQRRRDKAEAMAKAQGQPVSFEDLLRARGTSYDALARDPSVAIAALSRLWVDRTQGEEGLKRTYQSERDFFDGRFGVALRAYAIFLVAGEHKNELITRTFREADQELDGLKPELKSLDAFSAYAAKYSEDSNSRANGGLLGWIAREDPRFPEDLRRPLFEYLDGRPQREASTASFPNALIGPVHFQSGSALLFVSEIRPQPDWETMKDFVHEELRRRLIEELLPIDQVELVVR